MVGNFVIGLLVGLLLWSANAFAAKACSIGHCLKLNHEIQEACRKGSLVFGRGIATVEKDELCLCYCGCPRAEFGTALPGGQNGVTCPLREGEWAAVFWGPGQAGYVQCTAEGK